MYLAISHKTMYDDIKEIYIDLVLLGPAYAVLYKSLHHLFILNLMNDKTRKSVLKVLSSEMDPAEIRLIR